MANKVKSATFACDDLVWLPGHDFHYGWREPAAALFAKYFRQIYRGGRTLLDPIEVIRKARAGVRLPKQRGRANKGKGQRIARNHELVYDSEGNVLGPSWIYSRPNDEQDQKELWTYFCMASQELSVAEIDEIVRKVYGRENRARWQDPLVGASETRYRRTKSAKIFERRPIPAAVRREVLEGASCAYCGETEGLEVDHIVPISAGGDVLDRLNLQPLCHDCNRDKKDKLPSMKGNPYAGRIVGEFNGKRLHRIITENWSAALGACNKVLRKEPRFGYQGFDKKRPLAPKCKACWPNGAQ